MTYPARIVFKQNQSQVGRPPLNQDYISGLVFYGDYPSGFSATKQVVPILSVLQAEQAGIKGDYSDETKATGTIAVTAIGSTGDVISVFVRSRSKMFCLQLIRRP